MNSLLYCHLSDNAFTLLHSPHPRSLSNDELLEILSQTRDPQAVQPHLIKCFDAVKRLQFGEGEESKKMLALISAEAEKVPFTTPPLAEGPVESWLLAMQHNMCSTLYDNCKACLIHLGDIDVSWTDEKPGAAGWDPIDRLDGWYFGFPAAAIIMVGQIEWTGSCTDALIAMDEGTNPNGMKEFQTGWINMIDYMVSIVRRQLTPNQRKVIGAKLTLDVHARDTNFEMIHKNVSWVNDFDWQKQLRYYWEEDVDDCTLRQTNTYFRYGYEYLGNSMRLVVTPLTDKCYMTLTGGLNLGMGGAPAGPAGTGKTETTKDLAKALARQCVVMNCGPDLTASTMGRFFSGLAQSGAWACFDEFNRIDIEVLSVIAQQVLTIMEACKVRAERFVFEGREIALNPNYGVFITMNPGYAGRAELPDNLKALVRSSPCTPALAHAQLKACEHVTHVLPCPPEHPSMSPFPPLPAPLCLPLPAPVPPRGDDGARLSAHCRDHALLRRLRRGQGALQ